jgi:NAD(P)H-dependent FMN reductase
MANIAVIVGSTRPWRKADDVARWVMEIASLRSDAFQEQAVTAMLDQVVSWSTALQTVRNKSA